MRLSLLDNRRNLLLYLDEDKVIPKYTVTWKNWDGTELYVDTQAAEGGIPAYVGPTPTKPATQTVRYEFAGWTPSVVAVTGNTTYTATFTEVPIIVQVQWLNYDSSVIKMEEVQAGTKPTYSGTAPTKPSTAQYRYNFTGWSPSPAVIYEDMVYTAQFQEVPNTSQTVQFLSRTMTEYISTPTIIQELKISDGTLSPLVIGAISTINGIPTIVRDNEGRRQRRVVNVDHGIVPFNLRPTASDPITQTSYYPIPVPSDATEATMIVSPSTFPCNGQIRSLDNGVYTMIPPTNQETGSIHFEFTPGNNLYFVCLVMDVTDAEPTDVIVMFYK